MKSSALENSASSSSLRVGLTGLAFASGSRSRLRSSTNYVWLRAKRLQSNSTLPQIVSRDEVTPEAQWRSRRSDCAFLGGLGDLAR